MKAFEHISDLRDVLILIHEGYHCILWHDYFTGDLAQECNNGGIVVLVKVPEGYAGLTTHILYCDDDLYIMQRSGSDKQKGLLFVLNKAARWNGREAITKWANTQFISLAWRGKDNADIPVTSGRLRGYCVYAPMS